MFYGYLAVLAALVASVEAWVPVKTHTSTSRLPTVRRMASPDYINPMDASFTKYDPVNFGDIFNSYWGATAYEKQYGQPPPMAEGVYEIQLERPLGIVFEEVVPGSAEGVRVLEVQEGGNAAATGKVESGDVLVGVTGIVVKGARHERQLVPAQGLDFDTIMSAILSNEAKWGCEDIVLQLKKA